MRRYSTPACSVWRRVDERPAIGGAPDPLDVPEVPRVADAAGVALRDDVDGRHQRGEAADRVLERVVDAERRVEDVAVLRDAGVLQVEVADVRFVQQPRAERVRVRHAAEPRRCSAERRRRRRIGPAERLLDVLQSNRSASRASGSRRRARCCSEPKPDKALELGRNHLLQQVLAAERAVAASSGCRPGDGDGIRNWPSRLHVEDVERDRMDVGRCQLAERQAAPDRRRTSRSAPPAARPGNARSALHEVRGEPRIVLQRRCGSIRWRRRQWCRRCARRSARSAGRSRRSRSWRSRIETPAAARRRRRSVRPPEHGPAERRGRIVAAELGLADARRGSGRTRSRSSFVLEVDSQPTREPVDPPDA